MAVIAYREALEPGDDRGDGARRPRLPHGRGGRRVRRRLQGQPGDARPVRPPPGRRHADLRGRVRRHRHRRGDGRPAADHRVHDLQLQPGGDRPDRQQRRQHALHERRPVRRADRLPRQLGHGRLPGGHPLAPARGLVRPRPRPDRGAARHPGRRQGPAQERDPLRRPGRLHRARGPLRRQGRGPRRRAPRPDRQGRHQAARAPT